MKFQIWIESPKKILLFDVHRTSIVYDIKELVHQHMGISPLLLKVRSGSCGLSDHTLLKSLHLTWCSVLNVSLKLIGGADAPAGSNQPNTSKKCGTDDPSTKMDEPENNEEPAIDPLINIKEELVALLHYYSEKIDNNFDHIKTVEEGIAEKNNLVNLLTKKYKTKKALKG